MTHVCCLEDCGETKTSSRTLHRCPNEGEENYSEFFKAIRPYMNKERTCRKRLYICDKHFEKNCIEVSDIKIMKDGIETTVPRKVKRLKKNSIPTIFPIPRKKNGTIEESSTETTKEKINSNNAGSNFEFVATNSEVELTDDNFEESTPVPSSIDPIADCLSTYLKIPSRNQRDKIESSPLVRTVSVINSGPNVDVRQPLLVPENLVRQVREVFVPISSTSRETKEPSEEPYTVDSLLIDWNTLPKDDFTKSWSATYLSHIGSIFNSFDYDLKTRTVVVKHDMSVEVRTCGRKATYYVTDRITSFGDLISTLKIVTQLRLCEGYGEKYCPVGFFKPNYKSRSTRCTDCQEQHRTYTMLLRKNNCIEDREARRKRDYINLKIRSKKERETILRQRYVIGDLVEFFAEKEGIKTGILIRDLPPKLRDNVRVCSLFGSKNRKDEDLDVIEIDNEEGFKKCY